MWYKIDFNKLAILLLPSFLRKPTLITVVQILLIPIDTLYYKWSQFRTDNLYKLQHNGQVCFLRKALNDTLDPSQRRITINDGNAYKRKYIYTEGEKRTKYLGKIFLNQKEDFADTGIDFTVLVPKQIVAEQKEQLNALIQFYKLGGKRYKTEEI